VFILKRETAENYCINLINIECAPVRTPGPPR
jgi:hypothetical protein